MITTAQIVQALETAGYVRRGDEVVFAGFELPFSDAMTGPGEAAGLVVIEDLSRSSGTDVIRRVRSLLLGLESIGSRRQVALVCLSPGVDEAPMLRLGSMVRLIWVPAVAIESELFALLQPLLPIDLPAPVPLAGAALQELRRQLKNVDADTEKLMNCAKSGSDAVREAFLDQLERASTVKGVSDE